MAERDFGEFYVSNYGRLVVQVFAVTGNLADAEDAVQGVRPGLGRWGRGRRLRLARGVGPPGGAQPGLHGAGDAATVGGPEPDAATAAGTTVTPADSLGLRPEALKGSAAAVPSGAGVALPGGSAG